MKQHNHAEEPLDGVLAKINRNDGLTVPEGYFDSLADRIAARLPQQEWEKPAATIKPPSLWQRVRPYAYLAAMFAGVWCMMQIFSIPNPNAATDLNIGARPELAQALSDPSFVQDHLYTNIADDETDLMDSLFEAGFDPQTL